MITLRQVDFWGQLITFFLMIIAIPVFLFSGFMLELGIIGGWQLLSAGLNTATFTRTGYKKKVVRYWQWTGITLSSFSFYIISSLFFSFDGTQLLLFVILFAALVLSIYYFLIYHDLIQHLQLRKELSGLTKS